MKRTLLAAFLTLALGTGALYAADFWEKKNYTEWSDKEVRKMVNSSPWARRLDISMGRGMMLPGADEGREEASAMSGDTSGAECADCAGDGGGAVVGADQTGGRSVGSMYDDVPRVRVYLRWVSALPVRQAITRLKFGEEAGSSPEAAETLEREETNYIISVASLPARMVGGDIQQLKSRVALNIKSKEPITPDDIVSRRREEGVELYFFFPKGHDGSHVITAADKEVEFVLKLRNMDIKRKFKLKDMVYNGRLEL